MTPYNISTRSSKIQVDECTNVIQNKTQTRRLAGLHGACSRGNLNWQKLKSVASVLILLTSLLASYFPVKAATRTAIGVIDIYPGQDIQSIVNTAPSGTTIYLHAGTYPGFKVTTSGLIISGATGEVAVISGQLTLSALTSGQASNLTIQGALGSYQPGLLISKSSGITVLNNIIRSNSFGIVLERSKNSTVTNNNIFDNATGMEIRYDGGGVVINSNNIHDNNRALDANRGKGGINFYYTAGPLTLADNILTSNLDYGVNIYGASGLTIERNTFTGGNDQLETSTDTNKTACNNLIIRRNIVFRTAGSTEQRGFILRCASNSLVANNIFDSLDKFAFDFNGGSFGGAINNLRVLNNVVVNGRPFSIDFTLPTSIVIDYNDVWTTSTSTSLYGTQIAYVYGHGSTSSWSTFRSWTGYETHGLNTDPFLVNPGTHDYHLQSTSPVIDHGTTVGEAFNGPAPDMGRYEFGTATATATPVPSQPSSPPTLTSVPSTPTATQTTVSTALPSATNTSAPISTSTMVGFTATATKSTSATATSQSLPGVINIYPGQDVQSIVNAAPGGTTIYLHAGKYPGFKVTTSGLTISGAAGETAIVSGQLVLSALTSGTVSNLTIQDVLTTYQAGLFVSKSSGINISQNTIHGNSFGILLDHTTNSKIISNNIYDNASGLEVHYDGGGVSITSNNIHDNNRALDAGRGQGGVNFYYTTGPITFAENSLTNNFGVGVEIYAASGLIIERNTFTGGSDQIETGTDSNKTACNNITIRRNIAFKTSNGTEQRGFILRCASNSLVANNTFDGLDKFAFDFNGGSYSGSIDNLRVLNNVVVNGRPFSVDFTLPASVTIDFNDVWTTSTSTAIYGTQIAYVYGHGSTSSWSTFRSWTGYETHGLNVDPLLVNTAGHDYHLQNISPVIDRGTNVGETYSGSAPDMGRYESGVTAATATVIASTPVSTSTPTFAPTLASATLTTAPLNTPTATVAIGPTALPTATSTFAPISTPTMGFTATATNTMTAVPSTPTATFTLNPTSTSTTTPLPTATKTSTPTTVASPTTASGSVVVVAVGDIHGDGSSSPAAANLNTVNSINPAAILGLGDYQYTSGTCSTFLASGRYDSDWGSQNYRMYPSFGPTHDYAGTTSGSRADMYFSGDCTGQRNGQSAAATLLGGTIGPIQPYSFDVGAWHIVSLPSLCYRYSCDSNAITTWLTNDLKAHTNKCTIAYFHEPYWTSTTTGHAASLSTKPWVQVLYNYGVELLLQGHNHDYERFYPQNMSNQRDDAKGITAFIVGTGGIGFYSFTDTAPNSAARSDKTYGVLKLTLGSGSYSWQFVPTSGGTFTDSGNGTCH